MSVKHGPYQKAIEFIFDREHFGIKLGIKNIGNFLTDVGDPHRTFKSVHIAGTNGKGSTASYIDSIMRQAGYRVGIFTSPHLVDFRERICVDNKQISKKYIAGFIEKHRKVIEKNKITFFEVCTALAFCYFSYKRVDLAVVETGLGGRLDATNTLLPELSIITDISFDHTNVLGNTLTKIAYEKAGIIKKDRPVLVGTMKPEPRKEIIRVSKQRNAKIVYQKPGTISKTDNKFNFDYKSENLDLSKLISSLPGRHQILNSALAITAVDILNQDGYKVNKTQIRRGLKSTKWPGRFEITKTRRGPTIILDVGHNPAGIKAMMECFKKQFPGQKADVIFGSVRNKNIEKTIKYIIQIAKTVEIAQLKTNRGVEPKDIVSIFKKNKFVATTSESVYSSARKIIGLAKSDDIIIICGSHFIVGEFLESQKEIYGKKRR
ncbi:MAG: bifunctional folylpolyglutamate synthase/dihydrofolate synthase [candidate division Zixibacteria bacterium]|nr:bifunctional folylpolyglutamate synthase/dihydrofolate synthase [candidate division Zixibacteria bacterium]